MAALSSSDSIPSEAASRLWSFLRPGFWRSGRIALRRLGATALCSIFTANVAATLPKDVFAFDANGNAFYELSEVIESTALGDQTTRYQYDALGQKIAQTDALNRTTRWRYDGGGRVSSRTLPDGSHEDFLWDAIGNLIAYTDFDGQSVVHRYDLMDRKTEWRSPDEAQRNPGAQQREATTDHNGQPRMTSSAVESALRFIRATCYDPDGVLIGEDQITTANTTGTGGATGISVPGIQSTDYAIDRSQAYPQIVEERDGQSGKLIASHTWGITHLNETRTQNRSTQCGITENRVNCNGTEIDQIANPQTSWLLQDHLGSTRALTDNTGILTDRFDYNSYGQLARHNQTRFDSFEAIQQLNQVTQKRLDKRSAKHAQSERQETEGLLARARTFDDGTPSPFVRTQALTDPRTQALAEAKSQIAQTRSTLKSTSALSSSMLEAATAKTRHLFTGEQLSPSTGLGYHRARWLAFEVGRFTQMDQFLGVDRKPITLVKYGYASANPVNYADPGGNFTLGQMMTTVNIMSTLATNAVRVMTILAIAETATEFAENLDLLDGMIVAVIGGPAGFESMAQSDPAAYAAAAEFIGPNNKHHTIPVYMCGAKQQEYANIPFADHAAIHAKLYAGVLGVNLVAKALINRFLKKPGAGGRKTTDPIVRLAKKRAGRRIIGNFLEVFYNENDYWNVGKRREKIVDVFPVERREYEAGKTSLPSCKR